MEIDISLSPPINHGAVPPRDQDLEVYSSSWIWRAVESLVQAKNFNPSPRWIAERLNITVEKAVDAIEGLERINLIRRTSNGYEATQDMSVFGEREVTRANLLQIHSRLAPQILSKLTAEDSFTTQIFLGNRELVKKYVPRIVALMDEMSAEGLENGEAEVMALEISFASLTNLTPKGGQQ